MNNILKTRTNFLKARTGMGALVVMLMVSAPQPAKAFIGVAEGIQIAALAIQGSALAAKAITTAAPYVVRGFKKVKTKANEKFHTLSHRIKARKDAKWDEPFDKPGTPYINLVRFQPPQEPFDFENEDY